MYKRSPTSTPSSDHAATSKNSHITMKSTEFERLPICPSPCSQKQRMWNHKKCFLITPFSKNGPERALANFPKRLDLKYTRRQPNKKPCLVHTCEPLCLPRIQKNWGEQPIPVVISPHLEPPPSQLNIRKLASPISHNAGESW